MEFHPATLRFKGKDADLEPLFTEYYFRHSLTIFRWGFLLGTLLFASYGVMDAIYLPEVKERLWAVRYGLVVPMLLTGMALSFTKNFRRLWQPAIALMVLATAAAVFYMIGLTGNPNRYYYLMGIMLISFFGLTLIKARFLWAVPTHLAIMAMFVAEAFLSGYPSSIAISYGFSLFGAILIGLVTNYAMELFTRRNFYLMHRLRRQYRELRDAKEEIQRLSELLPICANCKKIRDDQGYWNQIESYLSEHSGVRFSHALCPECMNQLYGNESWYTPVSTTNAKHTNTEGDG